MEAAMISIACYRDFQATYKLTEAALYLKELILREKRGNYLRIGGVEPAKQVYQATDHELTEMILFTGKIRLARDFIKEIWIHIGYQQPTAFKTVFDIILKDRRVVEIKDRSQEMEKKCGAFKKHDDSGNLQPTIDEAFSLDMDLE